MASRQATSVSDRFERAMRDLLARFFNSDGTASPVSGQTVEFNGGPRQAPAIAVAYSGGLDSSVLLQLALEYARSHAVQLFAFHIHHGISPNADAWLVHCAQQCKQMQITFDARRVSLVNIGKNGVEEAARISRYEALGQLCHIHHVPLLLTAHHLDDQAETLLLQLVRGSGVAGLSGMDAANHAAGLLGHPDLVMGRPLLSASRRDLECFGANRGIACIEDESNSDPRYARNAMRHQVMPALARYFPAFQERLARTARHAQSAQRLLDELAAADLAIALDGVCLVVSRLQELSRDRVQNLLRYWFRTRQLRMPSTAWLAEMQKQLFDAKDDAQICVTHPDCHVRRFRDRIFITSRQQNDRIAAPPADFCWNGEERLFFPAYCGSLYFDEAERGLDKGWLRGRKLTLRLRQGGERLKLAPDRPTKSLKYHYQAFDVPAWMRAELPLLLAGEQLLFAGGIGLDCGHLSLTPGRKIQFRWAPEGGNGIVPPLEPISTD